MCLVTRRPYLCTIPYGRESTLRDKRDPIITETVLCYRRMGGRAVVTKYLLRGD